MIAANERVYRSRFLRRLKNVFKPGMHILDAGCGPGIMSELLTELGCKVTAVDVASYAGDWTKRRALGIEFKKGSTEQLDFIDAGFDGVWMQDAMHHMAWPEKTLAELLRVTKKGGPVVVVETNRQSPITFVRMTLMAGHETFNRRQFKRKLASVRQPYQLVMVETRCLPWKNKMLLALLNAYGNMMEALKLVDPWLTYQIAVLKGVGKKVEPDIDQDEPEKRRRARAESEAICQ